MSRKLGPDAFEVYLAMGVGRSYQAVAEHFDVSKNAVTALAGKERWQERLAAIEDQAREAFDRKAVKQQEEMRERHLRIARAVLTKALQGIQQLTVDSFPDAVRALEAAVKMERTAAGEVSERTAVVVERTVRREMEQLLEVGDGEGDDEPGGEGADGEDW